MARIQVWSDGSNDKKGEITKSAWIIKKDGEILEKGTETGGRGWSDIAEYRAIYCGLRSLIHLDLMDAQIRWHCDSEFVVNQCKRRWPVHEGKGHTALAKKVQKLLTCFDHLEFKWIPREQNEEADGLSKIKKQERGKK